jgi:hypothetical protein
MYLQYRITQTTTNRFNSTAKINKYVLGVILVAYTTNKVTHYIFIEL